MARRPQIRGGQEIPRVIKRYNKEFISRHECTTDNECMVGQICRSGQCFTPPACIPGPDEENPVGECVRYDCCEAGMCLSSPVYCWAPENTWTDEDGEIHTDCCPNVGCRAMTYEATIDECGDECFDDGSSWYYHYWSGDSCESDYDCAHVTAAPWLPFNQCVKAGYGIYQSFGGPHGAGNCCQCIGSSNQGLYDGCCKYVCL